MGGGGFRLVLNEKSLLKQERMGLSLANTKDFTMGSAVFFHRMVSCPGLMVAVSCLLLFSRSQTGPVMSTAEKGW